MSRRPFATFSASALSSFVVNDPLPLQKEEAHHLWTVRRVRSGDLIWVYDGHGRIAEARVHEKQLLFTQLLKQYPPPPVRFELMAAQLKGAPWEWLLEKSAELGVAAVHSLVTSHVESKEVDAALKRQERYRRFLIDGMKQSGCPFLPELHAPKPLSEIILKSQEQSALHLVTVEPHHAEDATKSPNLTLLSAFPGALVKTQKCVRLWVGPEAGWSSSDLAQLSLLRPTYISFGSTVFRAETAALFFLSVALHACRSS